MIYEIRNWCEELIIAIVLCIIIECLIPNGNNKKYAKVISGIYIMFITINPIFELLNYDFDFNELFDVKYESTFNSLDYDMKDIYIIGIEEKIKEEINNLGYKVNKIEIKFDNNYENIDKIEIELLENNYEIEEKYENIFEFLKENYGIEDNKIFITFS